MKKLRSYGIAGLFEDLPALIIVLVAIGLFTYSAASGYSNHLETKGSERLVNNLSEFKNSLRNYEKISVSDGTFNESLLSDLTVEELIADYDPRTMGFEYHIGIVDLSRYPGSSSNDRIFSSDSIPTNKNIFSMMTPILIKAGPKELHHSIMTISIWEV